MNVNKSGAYMKFLFSILITVLIPFFSYAQITIEEKIEIDPQQTLIYPNDPGSGDYYPCSPWIGSSDYYNPWQVVWYHSSYHLDVGQQAFNYQANAYNHYINPTKYYDFNVIDGQGLCHITENYIDTVNGNYIPPTNPGYNLVGIKGSDMIGELAEGEDPGNLPLFQGIPTRGGFQKYSIFFDQPGDVTFTIKETGTNEVISYHTTIVVPDYSLNVSISNEIPHGEEESIIAEADILNCLGMGWMFFNGGGYDGSYNYEITGGLEYATLVHIYFDEVLGAEVRETGTSFYNISAAEEVLVWLNGEEPDSTGLVNLTISTGIGTVNKQVNVVRNNNYPLRITINPDSLFPGDTADVVLENRVSESPYDEPVIYEPFPEDQYFNVTIVKGSEFTDIYLPDTEETGDEFEEILQGFKLIVNEGIDSSNVEIKLRVSTETGGGGFPVNPVVRGNEKESKSIEQEKEEVVIENTISSKGEIEPDIIIISGGKEIFGIGKAVVNPEEEIEILLGETKYFQAKYPDPNSNKLIIEEVKPGPDGKPELNGGLPIDVWGDNPVEVVECDTCGKKMGVYWEKEKPVWNGNSNLGNLEKGLIRIVGRYWHQDSTYIVKLKTKRDNGDSADIKLTVIRPNVLKSNNQADSYSKTRNVFDSVINIDSLCIYYGGINGIPPQFIKGHIYQEAAKINFGGIVGWGFAPSYRYEPYTVQKRKGLLEGMKNNPFYITATTNINPPNHQHVKVIPYFSGDTITVWQIVAEYSQLLQDGSTEESRLYGVRTLSDTMNYGKYKNIQKRYHSFFVKTDKIRITSADGKKRKLSFSERADSTNKRMVVYLRDEFSFNDLNKTKGMKNMIAQTRIASSYGYFQPLYTTAINRNDDWLYPENADNPPENLNKNDVIFPMATRMYGVYLEKGLNNHSSNNWDLGLESSLKKYILEVWNKDDKYPNEVMNNVNRFLPYK